MNDAMMEKSHKLKNPKSGFGVWNLIQGIFLSNFVASHKGAENDFTSNISPNPYENSSKVLQCHSQQ